MNFIFMPFLKEKKKKKIIGLFVELILQRRSLLYFMLKIRKANHLKFNL